MFEVAIKQCAQCGAAFEPNVPTQLYCTEKCKKKMQARRNYARHQDKRRRKARDRKRALSLLSWVRSTRDHAQAIAGRAKAGQIEARDVAILVSRLEQTLSALESRILKQTRRRVDE